MRNTQHTRNASHTNELITHYCIMYVYIGANQRQQWRRRRWQSCVIQLHMYTHVPWLVCVCVCVIWTIKSHEIDDWTESYSRIRANEMAINRFQIISWLMQKICNFRIKMNRLAIDATSQCILRHQWKKNLKGKANGGALAKSFNHFSVANNCFFFNVRKWTNIAMIVSRRAQRYRKFHWPLRRILLTSMANRKFFTCLSFHFILFWCLVCTHLSLIHVSLTTTTIRSAWLSLLNMFECFCMSHTAVIVCISMHISYARRACLHLHSILGGQSTWLFSCLLYWL